MPSMILHNGRIATVNPRFDMAEAVAIDDGRIEAVGAEDAILAMAGSRTRVIDLGGRLAVPGLIDSHIHLHRCALDSRHIPLTGHRSLRGIVEAIRAGVAQAAPGDWIVTASGWHESLLEEGRLPTCADLDPVSPDHPVAIPRGGHVIVANTKALELAGINAATPDPAGGVIVRDGDGVPVGILLEKAVGLLSRVMPPPPAPERQLDLLEATMRQFSAFGLTGIAEPGLDAARIRLFEQLHEQKRSTLRTDLMFWTRNLEAAAEGLRIMRRADTPMLRYTGLKFMLDGGVEGARMSQPYRLVPGQQTDPGYRGVLILPPGGEAEFVECLRMAARAGVQVQCHGTGDEGIDLIVRSYEAVNADIPLRDLRWTVMHMHCPRPDAIDRMRTMGLPVTVQDHAVMLGGNMVRWWGDERAARCTPNRTMIDAGLLLGGGTDGPIAPVDPFLSMWHFITRRTLDGRCLGPEEAITAREALGLFTINNARIMGVEAERGSLEPGKRADIAVLTRDILTIPPDEIPGTGAWLTLLDGKIVHEAP